MKLNNFIKALRRNWLSAEHVNAETPEKQFSACLQFCAVIRFNKSRIKSSVRASERRPPSQANAVTTLASQSLNVCKYCNKQRGFPHKRCSSSTGTDRRYGPWLQDEECCLPLSSPLFLLVFQGDCQSHMPTRPCSAGGWCPHTKLTWLLFCLCFLPLNPCPREPFRWIDFLLQCNIHYGSQYIMLSVCWKCRYSVTFLEYVCT